MKPIHDVFVGFVAIALGCLLIGSAIFQAPQFRQLKKWRLLAESVGQSAARWIITVVGLACIGMGALIISGWRIRW